MTHRPSNCCYDNALFLPRRRTWKKGSFPCLCSAPLIESRPEPLRNDATNGECTMISEPLLELHLRTLRLSAVLANYRRLLAEHVEPLPYLIDLISLEATKRHENGVRARIAAARFPTLKTIESFDFKLQPELP